MSLRAHYTNACTVDKMTSICKANITLFRKRDYMKQKQGLRPFFTNDQLLAE